MLIRYLDILLRYKNMLLRNVDMLLRYVDMLYDVPENVQRDSLQCSLTEKHTDRCPLLYYSKTRFLRIPMDLLF